MSAPTRDRRRELTTLIITTLTSFLGPFAISTVNVALPAMQNALRLNAVELSWVATAYLLAMAVAIVPGGKLADIYGRKRFFLYGILLYTAGCIIGWLTPNFPVLILARIMQGMGSALTNVTGVTILTSVFPPSQRGRVLGIYVAAVYIGLAVGPLAGGILTDHFGWRSIFAIMALPGLLTLILTVLWLDGEWFGREGQRFDGTGAVLYGMLIISLIYGASRILTPVGAGLCLFSAVIAVIFIRHQLQHPSPIFDLRLFSANRTFAFSSLAALLNYSATFAVTLMMSLYLQYLHGMTAETAGSVLMIQPLVMAFGSPLTGRLSDRVGSRGPATIGMALTCTGVLFFSLLRADTGLGWIIANLFLLGTGFSLFSSPNMNAIMGSVEKKDYSLASETVSIMRLLGQMTSMATMTIALSLIIGKHEITPQYYPLFLHSLHVVFTVSALCCFTGIFFSWKRGKKQPD